MQVINRETFSMNKFRITAVLALTACFFYGCNRNSTERRLKELQKIKTNLDFEHVVESDIHSLDVKMKIGNITVKKGEIFTVKAAFTHKQLKPEVTESNGKLFIKQQDKVNKLMEDKNVRCDLEIICPFGNSSGKNFSAMDLESCIGNISVDGISSDNVTVLCETGNLKVTDSSINEAGLKVMLGNLSVEGGRYNNINASSGTGNLKYSNTDFNTLESKVELGNTRLIVLEPLSDYTMDLSVSQGRITVQGEKQQSPYKTFVSGNKKISASCATGNITIN